MIKGYSGAGTRPRGGLKQLAGTVASKGLCGDALQLPARNVAGEAVGGAVARYPHEDIVQVDLCQGYHLVDGLFAGTTQLTIQHPRGAAVVGPQGPGLLSQPPGDPTDVPHDWQRLGVTAPSLQLACVLGEAAGDAHRGQAVAGQLVDGRAE